MLAAAPASFVGAVWSVLVMLAVLCANLLAFLLRHRIERAERLVQRIRHHDYVRQVQGPAAAVMVAAVSGYGINIVTQGGGLLGYLGFLLAMPLPLVMVAWSGYRSVRQSEFDRQWPPESLPAHDRVKIRITLRRVQAQSTDLATADLAQISSVLHLLLDRVLPALRQRRDRSVRAWLRDHRRAGFAILVWAASTIVCVVLAVVPQMQHHAWRASLLLGGFVLATTLIGVALLDVLRRHDRYRHEALAAEVAESAGRLRRRITEHRLGLATANFQRPS